MAMTPEQAIATANARLRLAQSKPEQGNMYTQSAEDIQYDPVSGVPLNTSSYGSGTTGATDYVRKALTTAAAAPINVATGVAKNVGGLAQTFNRYLGGESSKGNLSKAEEFVNAINQIEQGTQQQSESPNLLKVGSMIGQAAPWFATGNIGGIPSFVNAMKNVGTGMATGFASSIATPEQVGLTTDEYRNAKNRDALTQTVLGGVLPAAGEVGSRLVNALRGTKLSPQMETAIANARDLGYTVPPTQAGGGVINRLLEGLAGKASTLQEASVRNQAITDKLAKKSLGLPEDVVMTPEILKSVRNEAGKVYEGIGNTGIIVPKQSFHDALDKAAENAVKAEINFPNETSKKILETIGSIRKDSFDAGSAVSRISQLRTEADVAYRAGNKDLGEATKKAASALEDAIEDHLSQLGQPDALNRFKEARQLIAKTYTVEKAMNKTTGTVDAKNLASRLQAGKPMSAELKDIAQFAQAFPKAAQMPEKIGGTIGISPLDYTVAGITGGASLLGGEDKTTAGLSSLAALLARPAARQAVLSNVMQNRLVKKELENAAPGAIKQALPSSDEVKQLAKMLLMQKMGSSSENK